jgi:GTP cyclohydrolase II
MKDLKTGILEREKERERAINSGYKFFKTLERHQDSLQHQSKLSIKVTITKYIIIKLLNNQEKKIKSIQKNMINFSECNKIATIF